MSLSGIFSDTDRCHKRLRGISLHSDECAARATRGAFLNAYGYEKTDQRYARLGCSIVDLPERVLALLYVAIPTLLQEILHDRKNSYRYETNPAFDSAWANYMEC